MSKTPSYILRVNVLHNGVDMKKGDVCPEKFVPHLLKKGLLEQVEYIVKPGPAKNVKDKDGDGDVDADDEALGEQGSDETLGDDGEVVDGEGDESEELEEGADAEVEDASGKKKARKKASKKNKR